MLRKEEPIILIGNKADLKNKIKISEEDAKKFSTKNNIELIITSAKTGKNVEKCFIDLTTKILEKISQ